MQSKEDADEGKILIKILNKGFFKDDVIGVFEFDASFIYFLKDHTLWHQWLALSNPEGKDFNEITSYLKVSINITTMKSDEEKPVEGITIDQIEETDDETD